MPRMPRQSARTRQLNARANLLARRAREHQNQEHLYNEASILCHGTEFDVAMEDVRMNTCVRCKRSLPNLPLSEALCSSCNNSRRQLLFTSDNYMRICATPPVLKDLTITEQILIARVHPIISLYKIKGAQIGYSGNVINFRQDVQSFANRLPHDITSLSSLLIVNRQVPEGLIQFRVRGLRVLNALLWLKSNNIYYGSIIIDNNRLSQLPHDGDIVHQIRNLNAVAASNITGHQNLGPGCSTDESARIDESFCPNLGGIDQSNLIGMNLAEAGWQIDWPHQDQEPIDEFNTEGYIAQAFPHLFPDGCGDLRFPRPHSITPKDYFLYLFSFHDGRFANDARFRFFAFNSRMRWDAINCGKIFLRKSNFRALNIEQIMLMIERDNDLANSIMYYGSSLRGTRSYWKQRSMELLTMVNQLGTPTIFFTLSAADYHWKDLFKFIAPSSNIDNLNELDRRNLMHQNPLKTAWFFQHRVALFFKKVLVPLFNVADSWYRYEWQWRGSPHVHGLLWMNNAPSIENYDNLSDVEKTRVVRFFDSICFAVNPSPNTYSSTHPCRSRFIDLADHEDDLAHLINLVQRHTFHGEHCMKRRRGQSVQTCRFKFPQTLRAESAIEKDEGVWKFYPRRNDTDLQRYNDAITRIWRANTDFTPIVSKDAVLRYVAKYASKAEKSSPAYNDVLKELAQSRNEDDSPNSLVRKLLISSVSERDFSSQEVMHLMLGLPLYHATRTFITLPIESEWQPIDEVESSSLLNRYARRNEAFHSLTLFQYARRVRIAGNVELERAKEVIVRVVPPLKLSDPSNADDDFYKRTCIVHIPWLSDYNTLKIHNLTWRDVLIEHGLGDMAPQLFPEDDDVFEDDAMLQDYIHRNPDMIASRLGPIQRPLERLGHRTIDEAERWQQPSSFNLTKEHIVSFLPSVRRQPLVRGEGVVPRIFLSDSQLGVVRIAIDQLTNVHNRIKVVMIQGKAGSGKSTIIKEIFKQVTGFLGENDDNCPHIAVVAPTGVAATNVDGKTIHSFFRLPLTGFSELRGESQRSFQLKMKNLQFIIFDEYSMIGLRLLQRIDRRCKEAKSNNEPFGGLFIYFFGDLRQLPPVMDSSYYSQSSDRFSNEGRLILNNIDKKIVLSTSHRQASDHQFADILDSLSKGELRQHQWEILMSRRRSVISETEYSSFSNAIRLFATNEAVNLFNQHNLKTNGRAVARLRAEHNNLTASRASDDTANGLPAVLLLSVGSRVMLRKNLWVNAGLVNGGLGIVRAIIYEPDDHPPSLPIAVMVQFDRYSGPTINGLVPITPTTTTWKSGQEDCSRKQIPLQLSHAMTIHKSQGLTLEKAVVDIGPRESSAGLSYVALSRVKGLSSLIIDPAFNLTRLSNLSSTATIIARENFLRQFTSS